MRVFVTGVTGVIAPCCGAENPTSSTSTRARLDWAPTHRSLLDDLEHGDDILDGAAR